MNLSVEKKSQGNDNHIAKVRSIVKHMKMGDSDDNRRIIKRTIM